MSKSIALTLIFVLCCSAFSLPPVVTPHKSPELVVSNPSDPAGKTTQLSSLKGKVVVVEFFFIQSNHCLRVAKTLSKLNQELSPRGFQALGVIFDPPNVRQSQGSLIQPTIEYFKLSYPIGYASKSVVDTYLGRTGNETLTIPQMVVIDRAGFIRSVTGARVDPSLEDEDSLRALLDGLLKENPPAPQTKASAKARKTP